MKVILLGAGGGMGRTAARYLAQEPYIESLVLADYNEEAARNVASSITDAKAAITTTAVDVLNEEQLLAVLAGGDVVINCAGPFFRLGVPTLKAAIATKITYLDICDDPEPTEEMFALGAQAEAAGVVAIVGIGASPGLSNLIARRAADELDEVHNCYTAWPLGVNTPGWSQDTGGNDTTNGAASAAVVHLMEQIHGEILVVENGEYTRQKPLQPVELNFPGTESGTAHTVGHPEPFVLLPSLGLKGASANLIVSNPMTVAYLQHLQEELDAKRLNVEQAAETLVNLSADRALLAEKAQGVAGSGGLPPFFALATGRKDGAEATVGCHMTAMPKGMDGSTGIPPVLALRQLNEALPPAGIYSPEMVLDHNRLLTELLPFCIPAVKTLDALAPISISVGG